MESKKPDSPSIHNILCLSQSLSPYLVPDRVVKPDVLWLMQAVAFNSAPEMGGQANKNVLLCLCPWQQATANSQETATHRWWDTYTIVAYWSTLWSVR